MRGWGAVFPVGERGFSSWLWLRDVSVVGGRIDPGTWGRTKLLSGEEECSINKGDVRAC